MALEFDTELRLSYSPYMSCLHHDNDMGVRKGGKIRRSYFVLVPDPSAFGMSHAIDHMNPSHRLCIAEY